MRRDVACVNLAQGSTPLLSPSCSTSSTERRADRSPLVRYVHIKCAGFSPAISAVRGRTCSPTLSVRSMPTCVHTSFGRGVPAFFLRLAPLSLVLPVLSHPSTPLYIHTSKHCIYTHTRTRTYVLCILYVCTCARLYARMYDMCMSSRRYSRSLVSSFGASSNRI